MRVHVLYRTHSGANRKVRPSFYDRATAWKSLEAGLVALEDAVVTVVADGGVPAELDSVMGPEHRRMVIRGGRPSTSLRGALSIAAELARCEPEETLFWFAEDDYLYRPGALPALVAAAEAIPAADYFSLYTPDDSAWHAAHRSQPDQHVPPLPGGAVHVGGQSWQRAGKTTSTFGVRSSVLRADRWLLDLGSRVGAPFDIATWHALQSLRPFPWRHLLSDLDPAPGLRGRVKVVAKPVMRAVLDVVTAATGPSRVLVAPDEDLAAHLEVDHLPSGFDWGALAGRIARSEHS